LDGALPPDEHGIGDFEKFTATEHIEHQDIDRYGWPGPVKFARLLLCSFSSSLGKTRSIWMNFEMGQVPCPVFSDVIISTGP